MNQVLRDKPNQLVKIYFGGVNAENLVKPQTRIGQIPESCRNVNDTNCSKNC